MPATDSSVRLFLCGDVMLGRGIDQVLGRPSERRIYEAYVQDAFDYVQLAEGKSGHIPRPADPAYVWGAALGALAQREPDLRFINLETAITADGTPEWKGINYRMHPQNIECLRAARIDACVLANNHVLDWGEAGFLETLAVLHDAGVATAGAGRSWAEAAAPARFELGEKGRVRLYALASPTSGVPADWAATAERAGIWLLPDLSQHSAGRIRAALDQDRRPGDYTIVSLHWGGNWGYAIPEAQREFAHALIEGGADLVYGHSSHHPKGIEVYRGKLILYGCGDFINDYEGIRGYERYRGDLVLMYFADLERDGARLRSLELVPLQIQRFSLRQPAAADVQWLSEQLERESKPLGTGVRRRPDDTLELDW